MRNLDECTAEVFRRMEHGIMKRNKTQKRVAKIASSLCCVCLVTLIGVGALQNGWLDFSTPVSQNNPDYHAEHSYPGEANNNHGTDNTVEAPMKTINVMFIDGAGECAADMYRPEGYNDNIGSTLALKMSITEDADYKFSVIVRIPEKSDLKQVISDANTNNKISTKIDVAETMRVNVSGDIDSANKYFHLLTAEQIAALANSGAQCYYVGSGKGEYKDMNWDTPEGISTYCELNGDMYLFSDGNIAHDPDVSVD